MHDYHFLLMGQEMRASGWDGRMGFFLHIPFPAPEVFTALPQHQRLARGLCAFDLVGFQTDRDTANFRRYLIEIAGGIVLDDGRVQVFDQTRPRRDLLDRHRPRRDRRARPRARRAAPPPPASAASSRTARW